MKELINMLLENGIDAGIISMGQAPVSTEQTPAATTEAPKAEDIKLSSKGFRTLMSAYVAEKMVNESIEELEELASLGLMEEKKLTEKGKAELSKYLPTLFAS